VTTGVRVTPTEEALSEPWQADETTERNVRWLCREVLWAGVAGGIIASFLSIFALRLGASPFEVGLLTTGPAIAGIICPLPSARIVSRRWGKRVVVLPLALNRLLFVALFLLPWFPAAARVPLLVAAVTLASVPGVFFTTAFVPLLAKVLPPQIRARVVGRRSTLSSLTSTLAVLVVGKVLDAFPFPMNFQIIFIGGLITAQVSTFLVSLVRVPALNEAAPLQAGRTGADADSTERAVHTAFFWRHTASAVVFSLGFFLPSALYPIVQVDKLHASNGWIGVIATVSGLAAVLCSPFAARAVTRFGNRVVLAAGGIVFTAVPIGAGLAPSVPAYILVAAVMGGLTVAINLALFQCLLDVAPLSQQMRYTAMYSMIVNGAVATGPLLGTFLLSAIGMSFTFGLSALLVLTGSLLLFASDPALRSRVPGRRLRGSSRTRTS
jgi:MFS family permease